MPAFKLPPRAQGRSAASLGGELMSVAPPAPLARAANTRIRVPDRGEVTHVLKTAGNQVMDAVEYLGRRALGTEVQSRLSDRLTTRRSSSRAVSGRRR